MKRSRLSLLDTEDQREDLARLAQLTLESAKHPSIIRAARQITSQCESRDDRCELEAIYDAVKYGTDLVPGLENGMRYVADPRWADLFTAPSRILEMCRDGACAGDCDEHSALVAALCMAVGFKAGMRAWGPKGREDFTHVYAVVLFPKRPPFTKYPVALDTTVDQAVVGWEPPQPGHVLTAWMP